MTHKKYLSIALPFVLATMTTPLLGAVDTAIVGQMSDAALIAAVAIGTLLINTMLWMFGFLRVSTSGFTAQAVGAGSYDEERLALLRPMVFAIIIAAVLVALHPLIEQAAFTLLNPAARVEEFASEYFGIRVWGIPFALFNYVLVGWLMGKSFVRFSVMLQIGTNLLNVALSLFFVYGLGAGIQGVAFGTLLSEITAFLIGGVLLLRNGAIVIDRAILKQTFDGAVFWHMVKVNRDMVLRTICLLLVFNLFTAGGARFGTEVLAANALLLQIHYIMAYAFDGFANASSIYAGQAKGSKSMPLYQSVLKLSVQWSGIVGILLSVVFLVFQQPILRLFTDEQTVLMIAADYALWMVVYPVAAALGLVVYGMFTGMTEVAPVRNSIFLSLLTFLLVYWLAVPLVDNHGLWLAFLVFTVGRSAFLLAYLPKLRQQVAA